MNTTFEENARALAICGALALALATHVMKSEETVEAMPGAPAAAVVVADSGAKPSPVLSSDRLAPKP